MDNQGDSATVEKPARVPLAQEVLSTEDWWAIWIGAIILAISFLAVFVSVPDNVSQLKQDAKTAGKKFSLSSPLKKWWAKPGKWGETPKAKEEQGKKTDNKTGEQPTAIIQSPLDAFYKEGKHNLVPGILGVFALLLVLFGLGTKVMGKSAGRFALGFCAVFGLATLAYVLAQHAVVKSYNLEYALWAMGIGLLISNTIRTPEWVKPAVCTEFYIKTGLVALGAEVLLGRLVTLGVPGIAVAWVVTPIVLISTYWFGQKVIKLDSRSLNMVISADMSVCGVSAAIATAASCKAKKEELSFAIGLSLSFTVVMMIVMPILINALGLSPALGGAWLGGTIDSTGAVAVAGNSLVGSEAEKAIAVEAAVTVKMIQNILIGVVAFFVAVYWVRFVERKDSDIKPNAAELWYRFPKFVLGFVAASILFSILYANLEHGSDIVTAMTKSGSKTIRGWLFCLAFVSIGLDTNFRELFQYFKGGKSLVLYVCGQTLNILLTLTMAWLMFEVVYKDAIESLLKK